MKLAIIGLPQSGKSTIFKALTGLRGEKKVPGTSRGEQRIATIRVFDERLDFLTELYHPKKTTCAKIEYLLPSEVPASPSESGAGILNQARVCNGLLHVIRNFEGAGGSPVTPETDFRRLEEELILSDLEIAEKRIERIALDQKRGKKPEGNESELLEACREHLEKNLPLRDVPPLALEPALKGFTFLSAKPMLVIINNDDEDESLPMWNRKPEKLEFLIVRGRLEMEIAEISPEEAQAFREAYHIQESALDRVIRRSYKLLNLISFFTVISDEVRAWSVPKETPALEAAGTVHSDMRKGFIRAETLSVEDLKRCGTFQEAKKAGLVRLEGKDYKVKDGDIINFRFNI